MFDVSTKITLPCVCQSLPVFGYQTNHSVLFDILLLGVWMSDETLFLVFDILLVGVWISDETLFLVFDILLLSVWISDETLFLVFDILPLGVWISDESLFLVFDILLFQCLDIILNTLVHM